MYLLTDKLTDRRTDKQNNLQVEIASRPKDAHKWGFSIATLFTICLHNVIIIILFGLIIHFILNFLALHQD